MSPVVRTASKTPTRPRKPVFRQWGHPLGRGSICGGFIPSARKLFRSGSLIVLTVLITLMAIVTKLVGCGIGMLSSGWRRAGQVGIGMVPRGEVGIVVAQIGLGLAVINDALFGVVLFMAIATTLIAPPFIKLPFRGEVSPLVDVVATGQE